MDWEENMALMAIDNRHQCLLPFILNKCMELSRCCYILPFLHTGDLFLTEFKLIGPSHEIFSVSLPVNLVVCPLFSWLIMKPRAQCQWLQKKTQSQRKDCLREKSGWKAFSAHNWYTTATHCPPLTKIIIIIMWNCRLEMYIFVIDCRQQMFSGRLVHVISGTQHSH